MEKKRMENKMQDSKREEFKNRLVQLCVMAVINGTERVVVDLPSLLNLYDTEISKAREEGYKEGRRYQMELNEMLNGVSVQENTLEKGKEYVVISKETYNKLTIK